MELLTIDFVNEFSFLALRWFLQLVCARYKLHVKCIAIKLLCQTFECRSQ
jgi:hypothetical protein